MKKFILFFFALVASVCAFAQGTADFNTLTRNQSYSEKVTTEAGWVCNWAACFAGQAEDAEDDSSTGKFHLFGTNPNVVTAVCINGRTDRVGKITSPVLEGGCGTLSFDYAYLFSEKNGVNINIAIVQGDQTVASYDLVDTELAKGVAASWSQKVAVPGDFQIVITSNCPTQLTKNGDRTAIWNLSWTAQAPLPVNPVVATITAVFPNGNKHVVYSNGEKLTAGAEVPADAIAQFDVVSRTESTIVLKAGDQYLHWTSGDNTSKSADLDGLNEEFDEALNVLHLSPADFAGAITATKNDWGQSQETVAGLYQIKGYGTNGQLFDFTLRENDDAWIAGDSGNYFFDTNWDGNGCRTSFFEIVVEEVNAEVDFEKVNVAAIKQADFVEEGKWYLLKQKRGSVTPVHDEGVGATMKRAAKDDVVVAGTDALDAVDYLLRFIPTENEGAYNLQFANGHYWASSMTTTEEEPGEYNVYNINGAATHIGINLYNMDKIVDNNGAGNTLAFWESGEVTKLDGNNDWTVWEVEFAEKSTAAAELKALITEVEAAYAANNVVVEVGEGIITSTDQFSSEYTDEEEGSLENLLDGDGSTFWHSTWHHGNDTPMHVHYLQVEFAEPISGDFELNMNRRVNNGGMCQNDNPVKMSVETSVDGVEFVLADEFDTPFTQTGAAPLVQAVFNIPTAAKYLRFFADECNGGNNRGYWHCGDFQIKPIVVPAPNAAHAEAAAAFAEALAAAKACGANATDADVAALQAAYAAYIAALTAAPADLYPVNFDKALVEKDTDRKVTGFKLNDQEVTFPEYNTVYLDATNQVLEVAAGEELKPAIIWNGAWMHGIVYVDLGNDGSFDEGDLVAHSPYTGNQNLAESISTFNAPEKAGVYRLRVKTDWVGADSQTWNGGGLDAGGRIGADGTMEGTNSIWANRGRIIDVTLKVVEAAAPTTVDVLYTVKFNDEVVKTATVTETIGAAPSFDVAAPEYVQVAGMPETIAADTKAVELTTTLDETVPFEVGKNYVVFFRNGACRYYWNDSNEGVGNEVRWNGNPSDINSREELESYTETAKWTMGGNWVTGFTFTNATTGNTLTAPDPMTKGGVCNLNTEAATGFDIVKQSNGHFRFYVHGDDSNYLAHTSHGSHRVTFWNDPAYGVTSAEEGGASVVQFEEIKDVTPVDPVVTFPEEGKAYVVTNNDSNLFLNIVADDTKAAVLTAQPEKIFFEKKGEGWLIKDEEGNMIGGHAKNWNVAYNIEQVWNVVEVEGGYAFQRTDDNGKYLGFDKIEINPDDFFATAGFRDKNYATAHGVFTIAEYTFPLQHIAYKVKNVDAGLYMNITSADAKNVTIEKTPQEIFFTVAEDGGFYIQNKEGAYIGAGANDWTVANTPATWNVVEVEGGYAFQRTDATNKYLGLDSVQEGSAYFRDKGAAAHYAHIIMLFDTPETTPAEDLAAAIEDAKKVTSAEYGNVPADLFEDLAAVIEKAKDFANEDAAVADINDQIAAIEAAVNAIKNYVPETAEELLARLQAAVAAGKAIVKDNTVEDKCMGGLPGYKALDLVLAVASDVEAYDGATTVTRDEVVAVEHNVKYYNEALPCIPEVGKTYIIRNHPTRFGDAYSYVITAGEEGRELIPYSKVKDNVEDKHLWTVSEHVFKVEDDWGDLLFSETRYVFTNVATGQIFGYNGAKLDLCEKETDMNCWYFTQKTPKEIFAGSTELPYGTLGLQYNDGGNKYKYTTVDMRVSDLNISGSDVPMHALWNTYSSAFIFDVYEPEVTEWDGSEPAVEVANETTVKVTFTDAKSVEASNLGVLAAIYDEQGDVYGIVFNDLFGEGVEFNGDCATLHFKKISEINADLAASAKGIAAKVSAAVNGTDVAGKVVICGKSFKIDGEALYTKVIVKEFDFNAGGVTTGINGIASDADAQIFDLQGRRVVAPAKGLFINEGRKVVK